VSAGWSREEILRRFETWLDNLLAAEEPPRGLDAEILESLAAAGEDENNGTDPRCDSFALWAAMTALSQEVKLQGRAFKELSETMGTQAERVAEEIRAGYRERERDVQREAERRCRKEILAALIDLRDRLARGIESVRAAEAQMANAPPPGWLARTLSRKKEDGTAAATLAALIKGYELGVERLDQTLQEFNAREILCAGEKFDPRRMNAIDREESASVPEGTVLEVYRSGYEWNGEVYRPAQVKVSCAPAKGVASE
jgi:molecular chaperone GrpE